jgi:hypothetical protein
MSNPQCVITCSTIQNDNFITDQQIKDLSEYATSKFELISISIDDLEPNNINIFVALVSIKMISLGIFTEHQLEYARDKASQLYHAYTSLHESRWIEIGRQPINTSF